MSSDKQQLELIQNSLFSPELEEEAKKLLLREIYREVKNAYTGLASNGGKLAELPKCVNDYIEGKRNNPCSDDMKFTYNAIRVLMSRYISRTTSGKMTETPSMIMKRVSEGFKDSADKDRVLELLLTRRFVFNSPTLFNMYEDGAYGALSACYVTPVYDDMVSIMDGTVVQALTFKYGGGQGFSFSNLRPRWSVVKGTGSYSSGPLSFMQIYDTVTNAVKQGGKRRGANMGIMHVWHPDIYNPYFDPISAYKYLLPQPEKNLLNTIKEMINQIEKEGYEVDPEIKKLISETSETPPEEAGFTQAKEGILGDVFLTNFNLSVGVNDAFIKSVIEDKEWLMITPQVTGTTTGEGDYRIHYSFSKETGSGTLGEIVKTRKWIRNNPFINVFEEVIERSKPKAEELALKSGMNVNDKNPYIWKYPARKIWEKIVENAWKSGDPGLLFIDNHNKWSPTPWLGIVVATNPCVSGDTLILTKNGWKTAKELYEEGKKKGEKRAVISNIDVLGEGGETTAYKINLIAVKLKKEKVVLVPTEAWVWHIGKKNGVKITTTSGREIKVTKDHKFYISGEWVEAKKLRKGDKLLVVDENNNISIEEVSTIQEVIDDFYDFTVPIYHTYIANGLINHNCGEQYLYPYESCNLGSISVEKYVSNGVIDIDEFFKDVHVIIDAMDSVIDKNKHPDERQVKANLFTRKIGLGVMGLADALVKLGYPYDSEEAVAFTMILMASLEVFSWKRSWELGKERGPAPAFKCRIWDWRTMKCVEEGDPEELVELHTPALVKAGRVVRIGKKWVTVKYHSIRVPEEIRERLEGVTKERVGRDGSVRILKRKALDKVLREVFGITEDTYNEAINLPVHQLVNSPRHLVALAVFDPSLAWARLREYGKLIGAVAPRNTVTTTVAPTGTISIIAGTSSGIEPYFALVYKRKVLVGEFLEVIREFRKRILEFANKYGLSKDDVKRIFEIISENKGSVRWSIDKIKETIQLPTIVLSDNKIANPSKELDEIAKLFPTSMDFDIWYHIAHQAVAQLYVDQSISKTVNVPKNASVNSIYTIYLTAWLTGLKGVTVYRDESKSTQVIYFGSESSSRRLIIRKKSNGNGNGNGRRGRMRMVIPKKTMKKEDMEKDPVITTLVNVKTVDGNSGEVVVELEENSTCKTCDL